MDQDLGKLGIEESSTQRMKANRKALLLKQIWKEKGDERKEIDLDFSVYEMTERQKYFKKPKTSENCRATP